MSFIRLRSWDDWWLDIARTTAQRSKCSRRQVGAVVVAQGEKQLVSIGYNGAPAAFPEKAGERCVDFCPRAQTDGADASYSNCVSVHAEVNALLAADRNARIGGTLYVTSSPCWDCAKVIANSGIDRVVALSLKDDAHRNPQNSVDFLRTCLIHVDVIEGK